MGIQERLQEFIETKLVFGREQTRIGPDESLVDNLLDSLDVLRLVVFIEEQFGIKVEDNELLPENFRTLRELTAYIQRKCSSAT